MRIFMLVNNWLGWQCLLHLRSTGREVVGMAIHPPEKRTFGDEILEASGLSEDQIFDGSGLDAPDVLQRIRALDPEIGVSILFDYILKPELFGSFPHGTINLHPSFLPYNRGQYPNVWSIVEGTPAGVTLHLIDEGVDTGDILAQRRVPVRVTDTGESLYRRLEGEALDLFRETWPAIERGEVAPRPQPPEGGTTHRRRDVEKIDEIDLSASYEAGHLLNILRARTFPPHGGAYFVHEGRRIHVRVQLIPEEDLGNEPDDTSGSTSPRR